MTGDTSPNRLTDCPISAPAWVWLLYAAMLAALGFCPGPQLVVVLLAAAFSFQFWTFAIWRGLLLALRRDTETGTL